VGNKVIVETSLEVIVTRVEDSVGVGVGVVLEVKVTRVEDSVELEIGVALEETSTLEVISGATDASELAEGVTVGSTATEEDATRAGRTAPQTCSTPV
jgi:hypothetical protein